MARNESLKWLLTAIIIISAQFTDIILIPDDPFWYLYIWGVVIDTSVFLLIFLIHLKTTWLILAILQASAVFVHLIGLLTELSYNVVGYEQIALVNDQYTTCLITLLTLKVLVLLVAGNGIRQRYIRNNMGSSRSDHNSGLIVISNMHDNQRVD